MVYDGTQYQVRFQPSINTICHVYTDLFIPAPITHIFQRNLPQTWLQLPCLSCVWWCFLCSSWRLPPGVVFLLHPSCLRAPYNHTSGCTVPFYWIQKCWNLVILPPALKVKAGIVEFLNLCSWYFMKYVLSFAVLYFVWVMIRGWF